MAEWNEAVNMDQSPLDALAERIARIGRRDTETAVGSMAAVGRGDTAQLIGMVDQAIAAMDQTLRRTEDKTATALEAVARWMERSEPSMQKPSAAALKSPDAAMARMLALLVNRLEDIDGKINAQSETASAPMREAITRIEQRIDALGKLGASAKPSESVSRSLGDLDKRLAALSRQLDGVSPTNGRTASSETEKMTEVETKLGKILETLNRQSQQQAADQEARARAQRDRTTILPSRRPSADMRRSLAKGDLADALADISARQKDLDAGSTRQRLRRSAPGSKLPRVKAGGLVSRVPRNRPRPRRSSARSPRWRRSSTRSLPMMASASRRCSANSICSRPRFRISRPASRCTP